MANVTTLPEFLQPLMAGTSLKLEHCAVCGKAYPLNQHHVVRRGAGKLYRDGREVPKPCITLCGSGNTSGCHGLAHANRLHFRWVATHRDQKRRVALRDVWTGCGHWEFLMLDEPTDYLTALGMDGWRRLPRFRHPAS